jgi:hypothetical protein
MMTIGCDVTFFRTMPYTSKKRIFYVGAQSIPPTTHKRHGVGIFRHCQRDNRYNLALGENKIFYVGLSKGKHSDDQRQAEWV